MSYTAQELNNLERLLLNSQKENVELAFQIIEANGFPDELKRLISFLFALNVEALNITYPDEHHFYIKHKHKIEDVLQQDYTFLLFYYSIHLNFPDIKEDLEQFPHMLRKLKQYYTPYLKGKNDWLYNLDELSKDLVDNKYYDYAQQLLDFLEDLEYNEPKMYLRMGWLYQNKLKNLPRAIGIYEKAIDFGGSHPTYYSNLGQAYGEVGRLEEAEKVLKEALQIRTYFPSAKLNLAYHYWKYDTQYNKALEEYIDLLHLDLGYNTRYKSLALCNCAALLVEHYDLEKKVVGMNAEDLLKRAIKLDDSYDYAWKIYGKLQLKKPKHLISLAEARRCFQLAHQYDPNDEETFELLQKYTQS